MKELVAESRGAVMATLVISFFFQAEDAIRDRTVTGVQTCALPISSSIPYVRDGRFGNTTYQNNPHSFGPRLGMAYALNSKTVIRTGAGIYYVNEVASSS